MRSLSQLPFTCFMPVWVRSGCAFCWWMLARQTEWKGQLCLSARALQMQPHRNVICPSRITCRPGRHLTDFETFHFGKNHIRQQYLKLPCFANFTEAPTRLWTAWKLYGSQPLLYFFFFLLTPHSLKKGTFLELIPLWLWFYCSLTSHLACQIKTILISFSLPTFIPPVVCDICVFVPFQERMGKQKWNRKCWRLNKESV